MKKKLVAVMICAAMVAMLGVGCGSKSSDDSSSKSETKKTLTEDDIKDSMKGVKLKVGTTGLFGPFSYYDEDGKTLIGYDLDLINDLQDLLGFEIFRRRCGFARRIRLLSCLTRADGLFTTKPSHAIRSWQCFTTAFTVNADENSSLR